MSKRSTWRLLLWYKRVTYCITVGECCRAPLGTWGAFCPCISCGVRSGGPRRSPWIISGGKHENVIPLQVYVYFHLFLLWFFSRWNGPGLTFACLDRDCEDFRPGSANPVLKGRIKPDFFLPYQAETAFTSEGRNPRYVWWKSWQESGPRGLDFPFPAWDQCKCFEWFILNKLIRIVTFSSVMFQRCR